MFYSFSYILQNMQYTNAGCHTVFQILKMLPSRSLSQSRDTVSTNIPVCLDTYMLYAANLFIQYQQTDQLA